MTNQQIVSSINSYPITIILVTTKNSNPDKLLVDLIQKITNFNSPNNLNNYSDLIKLSGSINSIKKDDVIKMKNQLNYSSIEKSNFKFFYIKKIDNSSKEVFNTLLKFIEDMNSNNVGILTTHDLNLIPNTVKSRCNIFFMESDNESLKELLQNNNLMNETWLTNLFDDLEELELFIKSNNFISIKNLFYFFNNLNLLESKKRLEEFKLLNYLEIKILIKALLNLHNDHLTKSLLEIYSNLKFNPIKTLIFTKLLMIMEKK